MKFEKPTLVKITKEELKKLIVVKANSACGNAGCDSVFSSNTPDCNDVYHNACIDEENWTSGDCISGGSWKDK